VLHHLLDPVAFLASVRAKFPQAIFLVWEHDKRKGYPTNVAAVDEEFLPPRSYGWWEEKTLRLAMERAGYVTEILNVKLGARYAGVPGAPSVYFLVRRLLPFAVPRLVSLYYYLVPLIGWPKALLYRWRGKRFALAIGRPNPPHQSRDL